MNRSTQTESLHKTKQSAGTVREIVFSVISAAKAPLTRSELHMKLGQYRQSSITGRVSELLRDGRIQVVGKKFDAVTDRWVETLAVASETLSERSDINEVGE